MAQHIEFQIEGLSCASCVRRAEQALAGVEGVSAASVNLATERAQVTVADDICPKRILEALATAGYPAREAVAELAVSGMSCASCVGRVEKALVAHPGVIAASVNLATETVRIRYFDGAVLPGEFIRLLAEAGYQGHVRDQAGTEGQASFAEAERAALARQTVLAGVLTLPVFLIEMGGHFVPAWHHWIMATLGQTTSWMIQFILVTCVMVGPGRRFYAHGIPALMRGAPDMNALVALGTLAAWSYSVVALFLPGVLPEGTQAVYFEAAAVIITLILLGRWIEARAKGRAGAAIARLTELVPETAEVMRDNAWREMALAEVVTGDRIRLRPGARVPVDGIVEEGTSFLDESMVTGEPMPVAKEPGDSVTGGTVNGTGALTLTATAVGAETVLARIVEMVQAAQGAKLPIQALVDRVTGVFVPIVIGIAVLAVAVWLLLGPDPALGLALVAGVSVLIVACPCAMGLATPMSILVGTGRAAELGVLFRRGDALQRLQEVQVIAFDKTGTLTQGHPVLIRIVPAAGQTEDAVLARAAAIEARSEHPVARALVTAAEGRGLALSEVAEFLSVTGQGAEGRIGTERVLIGSERYLNAQGVDLSALAVPAGGGLTTVYLARNGVAEAAFQVADPLKPTTAAAITALRAQGMKVALISGDAEATANHIAAEAGIDHVIAGVMPDGKVAALDDLRRAHGPVAFVGDGINDAPALAHADIGIAVGTGTDVAIEAADVVLMSGDLAAVTRAVTVSRATMRNIRQNLFWAFAYNAALLPVAAGVLYPVWGVMLSPALAAGAMALSSVFVVTNALRLRRVGAGSDPAVRERAPMPLGQGREVST